MNVRFLKWKDPSKVNRDDYPDESLEQHELVDLLDAASSHPFKPTGGFTMSAGGIIPSAPHNSPSELYDLWVMHTDGHITPRVMDSVMEVAGVEVFDVWTPYRAWIGIGLMFDREKVFHDITVALSK